jgi:hypothetical protein
MSTETQKYGKTTAGEASAVDQAFADLGNL